MFFGFFNVYLCFCFLVGLTCIILPFTGYFTVEIAHIAADILYFFGGLITSYAIAGFIMAREKMDISKEKREQFSKTIAEDHERIDEKIKETREQKEKLFLQKEELLEWWKQNSDNTLGRESSSNQIVEDLIV